VKHLREPRAEDVTFSRKLANASKDNINMSTLFQRGQVVRTKQVKQALALAIQEHIDSTLSRNECTLSYYV
jgi:hypothetical protein